MSFADLSNFAPKPIDSAMGEDGKFDEEGQKIIDSLCNTGGEMKVGVLWMLKNKNADNCRYSCFQSRRIQSDEIYSAKGGVFQNYFNAAKYLVEFLHAETKDDTSSYQIVSIMAPDCDWDADILYQKGSYRLASQRRDERHGFYDMPFGFDKKNPSMDFRKGIDDVVLFERTIENLTWRQVYECFTGEKFPHPKYSRSAP